MSDETNRKDKTGTVPRRTFLGAVGATAVAVAASRVFEDRLTAQTGTRPSASTEVTPLRDGWMMQSSASVTETGDRLSQPGHVPQKWYPVSVPSTVLAGLVANGEYADLFYGNNLSKVPAERFTVPWWYRKEFMLTPSAEGRQVWLYFKGINYRANIWLNGQQIAASDKAVGTYRDLEYNITALAHPGANALAVEVIPPAPPVAAAATPGGAARGRPPQGGGVGRGRTPDLGIAFVDWNPPPPDQNMGIWQEASLLVSGPVSLRYPHVITDLELPSLAAARLTIMADLTNAIGQSVTGTLEGRIEQIRFSQEVTLGPHETRTVSFTPEAFKQLVIRHPRVWWPWQLGKAEMYNLSLSFSAAGKVSDRLSTGFGIRKVTSRLTNATENKGGEPSRLFNVNGVDLLVFGAGYSPDMLQRRSLPNRPDLWDDHLRYVRDMNLNTIRQEGKMEDDVFYDMCDRQGILIMAGWCCCSAWERWNNWGPEQHDVAMASLRYQIRKLRAHPSMLVWCNGSDHHPTAEIEKEYLAIEEELKWPCPTLNAAIGYQIDPVPDTVSEFTGVKQGPYDWVPPVFWYSDKNYGAVSFSGESGPGPQPPPLESLKKMIPPEHRWPVDEVWNFHCGGGSFRNLNNFIQALDARFGPSQNIGDFVWKAEAQAYETMRAMWEAGRRNRLIFTGRIQWMLNNAWPSMIWHLYDYFMRPGSSYFATKIGCEPLHILYAYDDRTVWVVNDSPQAHANLTARAEIYDMDAKLKHQNQGTCNSPANSSVTAFRIPELKGISTTHFLRLTLEDASRRQVSVNSYWLSTKPDVREEGPKQGNRPRWASYTDYTQLQRLPAVKLNLGGFGFRHAGEEEEARVQVANGSEAIALLVRLKITKDSGGEELIPIRWQDNYFMLLPGEKRQLTARYFARDLGGASPKIAAECFNNDRKS
jgi:exo-1,4-beta-D-glucosaminidase